MRGAKTTHDKQAVAKAATLFFAVRGLVRTKLAQGKKFGPSAWLRIETLKFIADHAEPSMKDVADYLSITAPSATSLISSLITEGLVARRTDARDRRASRLRLTPRGARMLAQKVERGTKLLEELFSPLSEAELAAFIHALERVNDSAGR